MAKQSNTGQAQGLGPAAESAHSRIGAALQTLSRSVAERVAKSEALSGQGAADLSLLTQQLDDVKAKNAALEAERDALQKERVILDDQLKSAKAGLTEKNDLKARVARLETENLTLHEQVAAHSLSAPQGDANDAELRAALASLKAEKKMLEDRYSTLKSSFAALEKQQAGGGAAASDTGMDHAQMTKRLSQLEAEREDIKATLDLGIDRIERVLSANG